MGKWLAIGGAALLVVLFLLWKQLDSPSATAATPEPKAKVVPPPPQDPLAAAKQVVAEEHAKAGVVETKPVDGKPAKIDPASDEFFYKFIEVTPAVLSREVVKCYDGRADAQRLHRNQKLTLDFKIKIKDGEVTISNVREKANTLNDPALTTCFTQAVQRKTWHDDSLPDWEGDDQLVIRPERGLKKYMKSNIDYVGAEAPRADDDVIRPKPGEEL
jgi:hypothetical protein